MNTIQYPKNYFTKTNQIKSKVYTLYFKYEFPKIIMIFKLEVGTFGCLRTRTQDKKAS